MSIYAKVVTDSISDHGHRLTTMEVQCHRFVLAEFNTHRRFSRNSASSRAIPFQKQLQRMEELGLAYPLSWPKEQKGMQGGEEFSEESIQNLRSGWEASARGTIQMAQAMYSAGLHKSVINRLLEPFMWHKIIVSATEWQNFFDQRCSPLAQPEIRVLAEAMEVALDESSPEHIGIDNWHLPYIDEETILAVMDADELELKQEALKRISAARCARVSYLTHDGKRDIFADLDLFDKLVVAKPPHWSPLEHVATPDLLDIHYSNFDGWIQLRGIYELAAQAS